MAFLDVFIRPKGTAPPLKQPFVLFWGRISCFIVVQSIIVFTSILYFFRQYKELGFAAYLLVQTGVCAVDGLVNNKFGRNIERIRRAVGYSDATILAIMGLNLVASQFLGYLVVNYIAIHNDAIYTWEYFAQRCVNLEMVAKIATNLALVDVAFYLGHSLMHKVPSIMKIHVLHHCSIEPTWNSNLLFHPMDLLMEFALPVLCLLLMHFGVWQDDAILVYSYVAVQFWYAYDHDEMMRLPHSAMHHAYCDSSYAPYNGSWYGKPSDNRLKRHMDELGILRTQNFKN